MRYVALTPEFYIIKALYPEIVLPSLNKFMIPKVVEYAYSQGIRYILVSPLDNQKRILLQYYGFMEIDRPMMLGTSLSNEDETCSGDDNQYNIFLDLKTIYPDDCPSESYYLVESNYESKSHYFKGYASKYEPQYTSYFDDSDSELNDDHRYTIDIENNTENFDIDRIIVNTQWVLYTPKLDEI